LNKVTLAKPLKIKQGGRSKISSNFIGAIDLFVELEHLLRAFLRCA